MKIKANNRVKLKSIEIKAKMKQNEMSQKRIEFNLSLIRLDGYKRIVATSK